MAMSATLHDVDPRTGRVAVRRLLHRGVGVLGDDARRPYPASSNAAATSVE
jgi:hypothetical protein